MYDTYLESRIFSADPVELVQILYESALESVERARRQLRDGDIAARSKEISRTGAVLAELAASVKHDAGPELARNLVELYDYMQRRLLEANFKQAEAPLAEVAGLLATLLEGWRSCRVAASVEAEACPAPRAMLFEEACEPARLSWTA